MLRTGCCHELCAPAACILTDAAKKRANHRAARSPALRAAPRRTQRGDMGWWGYSVEVSSFGAVCAQWSARRTARSTTSTQSVTRCISSIRQGAGCARWSLDWRPHTCRTLAPIPMNRAGAVAHDHDHAESCVSFTKRSVFDGRAMRWMESYGDWPATRPTPSLPRAATTGAAPPPNPQDSLRPHSVVPTRACAMRYRERPLPDRSDRLDAARCASGTATRAA